VNKGALVLKMPFQSS